MKVSWGVLDAAQNWRLDWSVSARRRDQAVNDLGLVETLDVQVVHQVVGVIRSHMASGTLSLAEENFLAVEFLRRCFFRVELSEHVEFGRRGKIEYLLKFRHVVNLAAALQDIDPFFGGDDRVSVEVGRALLEFRKILNSFQGPLRTEQPLDVDSAQGWRVDPVAHFLGTNVSRLVSGRVGAPVLMAIKARDSQTWMFDTAIRRLVELLLREWGEQQPQAFQLFGIQHAVKQRVIVAGGDHLSLGDVSEVGSRGQINCCWKFWKEVVRYVEVNVKTRQVSARLFLDFINCEMRKDHAPFDVLGMRQGEKARRK